MRAIYAIALMTVRSALRSHMVKVLVVLLILAAVLLPMTIVGDDTAHGQLQIMLNYCLGIIGGLLSIVTLWLGCTSMGDDIEGYQIHMVLTKPVSRVTYWLGKWFGIIALQVTLLILAAISVLAILYWRFEHAPFPDAQMIRLRQQVMVGRNAHDYDRMVGSGNIDFAGPGQLEQEVREEFVRQLDAGQVNPHPAITERTTRNQIRRTKRSRYEEMLPGAERIWTWNRLPDFEGKEFVHLRFRMFVESATSKDHRQSTCMWWLKSGERVIQKGPQPISTGTFQEMRIDTALLSPERDLSIRFRNLDPKYESLVFPLADGPKILVRSTGFVNNYMRVVALLILQVMFVGIIGCTAGAALSTPVAIFLSVSYLVIGGSIMAMQPTNPEDIVIPTKLLLKLGYYVREAADLIIISINEFNEIGRLAKGELVDWANMISITIKMFVLRGIPIAALGMWALHIKELGLVTKR